jgi:hypothetical protein
MADNEQENSTTATQTPKGYGISLLLRDVSNIVSLPEELVRCVFAVALSTKINLYPPLWIMLVGVPSSAKTDLVSLLRRLEFVYFIDSFTMNPFASGYKPTGKGEKTYDLLPELNEKCFVCKDYTTIFSLNEETTKKLLGELVSIYDGEFAKFSPTRGYKTYKSSFSHIGCITPAALNRHQKYLNIVGPRFLFYRIPALSDERKKKGFIIAWNFKSRKEMIQEMAEQCVTFFNELLARNITSFDITDLPLRNLLEKLSLLMARSRGIVILQKDSFTNEDGKQITYFDVIDRQIEEPWRALQQLKGLAVSLALLDGRTAINEADCSILKSLVISSMPAERAEVLEQFRSNSFLTARQLSDATNKSIRTCQRLLKELEGLDIVISDSRGEGIAKTYNLQEEFAIIKTDQPILQPPSESLSHLIPDKPVSKYTQDEIEGIMDFLTNYVKDTDIPSEERDYCKTLSTDIANEGIRRGIFFPTNTMSIEDQASINQLMKGVS